MLASRQPVNYAKMLPRTVPVALFGEMSHYNSAYQLEIIEILPELKSLGFTHLALEMIPYDEQEKLNNFYKSDANAKELQEFIEGHWSWGEDNPIPAHKMLFKIIETARSLDMKIVGLDMPVDQHKQYDICTTDEMFYDKTCKQSSHLARNHVMTNIIEDIVKNGGRCIAFMHYFHAVFRHEFETGIGMLLKQKGIKSITIQLQHPNYGFGECEPGYTPNTDHGITVISEAFRLSADKERFYIEGHLTSVGFRGHDYTVFLPCD